MDKGSFWTVDAAGGAGKTAQAAHGFSGTRQNASFRPILGVHLENVGLGQPGFSYPDRTPP